MEAVPRVWVLLGKGAGGNAQMCNLADALGWPYETKRLAYNRLERLPNLLLAASAVSVDRRRSSPLVPPWPDLVIGASRRSAPVARWIRKRSGGRARLVHLLHVQAPLDRFDLVVTTPQYCLPELPNVLHNVGPLNRPDAERMAAAAARWSSRLDGLPRPFVVLLAGGNSSTYELDGDTARRLGRDASGMARAKGGTLLVSTSPRTPGAAADALCQAIDGPSYVYRWRPDDPDNPYVAFLALADCLVVTVDSASQLVEACATGKPVHLFEWPMRPGSGAGFKGLLRRWRRRGRQHPASPAARLHDRLVYLGLIKPPRDFAAFHQALCRRGLLAPLGAGPPSVAPRPLDDLERAVQRVRALFAHESGGPPPPVREKSKSALGAAERPNR
jgi:uncharacterized protein